MQIPRVLLIEDDVDVRMRIRARLLRQYGEEGVSIDEAPDMNAGLKLARQCRYDTMIVDPKLRAAIHGNPAAEIASESPGDRITVAG
jgi:DNA-binding response OmpR family regulator